MLGALAPQSLRLSGFGPLGKTLLHAFGLRWSARPPDLAESPLSPEHLAAAREIQGRWRVDFSPHHDGKGSPVDGEGRRIIYTFHSDRVIKEFRFVQSIVYRLDPTRDPKQIDLRFSLPEPWLAKGIYRWKGNTLVICYGTAGAPRPADFSVDFADKIHTLYLVRFEDEQ
jgi:uncharacterized protein (TIGR03067 family)